VDFVLVWFRPNIPQEHVSTRAVRAGVVARNVPDK